MAKYYMLMYIHVLSQSTTCSGKHGGKVLYVQENMVAKYYMLRKTRWQSITCSIAYEAKVLNDKLHMMPKYYMLRYI
jgi:hypothetical protein